MPHYRTVLLPLLMVLTLGLPVFSAGIKVQDHEVRNLSFYASSQNDTVILTCPQYVPSAQYSTSSLQWRRFVDKSFPDDSVLLLELINRTNIAVADFRYSLQHDTNLVIRSPRAADGRRYFCQWIYRLENRYDLKRYAVMLYYYDDRVTTIGTAHADTELDDVSTVTVGDYRKFYLKYPVLLTCHNTLVVVAFLFIAVAIFYVFKRSAPDRRILVVVSEADIK